MYPVMGLRWSKARHFGTAETADLPDDDAQADFSMRQRALCFVKQVISIMKYPTLQSPVMRRSTT